MAQNDKDAIDLELNILETTMNSYHFDFGDSNKGPIGFCAQVTAASLEDAVEILKKHLPQEVNVDNADENGRPSAQVEYISVYFNADHVGPLNCDYHEDA